MEIKEAIEHAREVAEGCPSDRDSAYQNDSFSKLLTGHFLRHVPDVLLSNSAHQKSIVRDVRGCMLTIMSRQTIELH